MKKQKIAILGAGSWGTAMAIHIAKRGYSISLWGRDRIQMTKMQQEGNNHLYLAGIPFPQNVNPTHDFERCLNAEVIIIAVPSHAFISIIEKIPSSIANLAWLTKGLNPQDNQLLSDGVVKRFGDKLPAAIISGPSFAREVAVGLPTSMVIASANEAYQKTLHNILHHDTMRVYLSNDVIGVQTCGAVKNILAIACGISDGLGFGANAQAALITRGLTEMRRLSLALGAQERTIIGLAGLGDLVLTCTDNQSRNRRFGFQIGQGKTIVEAEHSIAQVIEGKYNAFQVCSLSKELNINMPICNEVNNILLGKYNAIEAVNNLINRAPQYE